MSVIVNLRPVYSKCMGIVDRIGLRYYDGYIVVQSSTTPVGDPFTGPYSGSLPGTPTVIPLTEADGYRCNVERIVKGYQSYALGLPDDAELLLTITRDYPGGGFTAETLQSLLAPANSQVYYLISGPGMAAGGSRFASVHLIVNAFTYQVGLRRLSDGT